MPRVRSNQRKQRPMNALSLILLWLLEDASSFSDSCYRGIFLRHRQANGHFRRPILRSATIENAVPTVTNNARSQCRPYPWSTDSANDDSAFHPNQPYYVFRPSQPIHHEYWQELCPPSPKSPPTIPSFFSSPLSFRRDSDDRASSLSSLDISLTWTPDEDPGDVARKIIQECLCRISNDDKREIRDEDKFVASLEASLVDSLRAYRDFCQTHVIRERSIDSKCDNSDCNSCISTRLLNQKLKCRLVATRGYSGAKCPQYHIDNIPCRWIQSMVGPGVELVNISNVDDVDGSGGVIRWDAFGNSPTRSGDEEDEDEEDGIVSWSVEDRNQLLVDSSQADIYCSKQGEAILIPGSSWDEYSMSSSSTSTKPVVHKSPGPEALRSDQCRLLFTQDIIFE